MITVVTGADGLVGRALVTTLSATSEVWALSRRQGDVPAGVHRIAGDLSTAGFVTALPARADTVVHLAQSVHYQDFPAEAHDVFAVNVASTARLLDWAVGAGVSRFILASAGGADRPPAAGRPSFYLATKRSAELITEAYRAHFSVTVLRFFFIYGPGQRASMLVPRLIESVRTGKPIALAGEDGIRLNPVHVADAAAATARAASLHLNRTIDVAGPEVLTMRALAGLIGAKAGRVPAFEVDRNATPNDLVGDITAMGELLVAPSRRFESGVADLFPGGGRNA